MATEDEAVRRKKRQEREVRNRIKNMSKEALAAAVARKKECNARALDIVQQLIEPNVQQIWLLENLKHINQSHFQDIVEERAITRFCGYPLCNEQLTNIPKKMYKISTKENKVYDITDRKHYCSNICYKAGTFLKDQLYTSPLWLRHCEIPVEYKILSGARESKGTGAGAEIDLGNTKSVKLDKLLSANEEKEKGDIKDINTMVAEYKSLILKNKSLKTNEAVGAGVVSAQQQNLTVRSDLLTNHTNDLDLQPDREKMLLSSELKAVSNQAEIIRLDKTSDENCINHNKEIHDLNNINRISNTDCTLSKTNENDKNEFPENSLTLVADDKLNNEINNQKSDLSFNKSNVSEINKSPEPNLNKSNTEHNVVKLEGEMDISTAHEKNLPDIVSKSDLERIHDASESTVQPISCVSSDTNNSETGIKRKSDQTKCIKTSMKGKKKHQNIQAELSYVIYDIEKRVESWFTLETLLFLLGQERVRNLLKINGYKEDVPSKKANSLRYQKCQEIYKKLNILELKDKEKQIPSKPVPDYDDVWKEAEDIEIKVRSFFQGDKKVTFAPTEKEVENSTNETEKHDDPTLPLIDQYDVMATRRRIFMERLNKVLPDMESALELSHLHLGLDIQELVSTFSLGPSNISMRPSEWTLVAIILIKMLSIRSETLEFLYSREVTQRRLITYLLTYDLDGGYIDRLMSYLMNIERIVANIPIE